MKILKIRGKSAKQNISEQTEVYTNNVITFVIWLNFYVVSLTIEHRGFVLLLLFIWTH